MFSRKSTTSQAKNARKQSRRKGFSLIEVLVVNMFIAASGTVLMVMVEGGPIAAARHQACKNNMNQLSLGVFNYAVTTEKFPNSNVGVPKNPKEMLENVEGSKDAVGYGWSWAVVTVNQLDLRSAVENLEYRSVTPFGEKPQGQKEEPSDANKAAARKAALIGDELFLCPSSDAERAVPLAKDLSNANEDDQWCCLASYKATTATCNLAMLIGYYAKPPVGKGYFSSQAKFPDGVLVPEVGGFSNAPNLDGIKDGASHTLLLAETNEPLRARWTIGTEMELVTCDIGSDADLVQNPQTQAGFYAPKDFFPEEAGGRYKYYAESPLADAPKGRRALLQIWDFGLTGSRNALAQHRLCGLFLSDHKKWRRPRSTERATIRASLVQLNRAKILWQRDKVA